MRETIMAGFLLIAATPVAAQRVAGSSTIDMTQIGGVIPPICTVEAASGNVRIEMKPGVQNVTDITYVCNSAAGLTRRVTSTHSGALVRGDQRVPYRLAQIGQQGVAFNDLDLSAPYRDEIAASAAMTLGVTGRLSLSIPTISPQLLAGEYSDTITIDITPN